MDIEKFKIKLKEITKDTFKKCKEKVNVKEICGFALYSDNSAMTISASLNLIDHLKEIQKDEPGFDTYFKFTPGEWKYEMINHKEFQELQELLRENQLDIDDKDFISERNKIYSSAVEVLKELKSEKLFKPTNDEFVLMFAVSDFSEPVIEIKWVSELNDKILTEEFSEWLESERDDEAV